MAISNRLKTIAQLVTPQNRVVDIGTDHGYVPVYLLRQGITNFAIAADLSSGSLEKARLHAARAGYLADEKNAPFCEEEANARIECRLSDGLEKIMPGEVDTIIIAGMGGILMKRILQDGLAVVQAAKELILSPHRDADLIRSFVTECGFSITEDFVLVDKKKTYVILKIKVNEVAALSRK